MNLTPEAHKVMLTTIDDKPALIVQPKEKGSGVIGLYIGVDSQTKFNLYGENIQDEETVLII